MMNETENKMKYTFKILNFPHIHPKPHFQWVRINILEQLKKRCGKLFVKGKAIMC